MSDEALPDRWYAVDLPVLRAVVQESLSDGGRLHQVAQETIADLGLDTREHVGPCLRRLSLFGWAGGTPFNRSPGVQPGAGDTVPRNSGRHAR